MGGGTISIPTALTSFPNTKLKFLALQENELGGKIPDEFKYFESLFHLDLSNNDFDGAISESLGTMTNLTYLFLSENPKLTSGAIPPFLGHLTNLHELSLKKTSRTGFIPDFVGEKLIK